MQRIISNYYQLLLSAMADLQNTFRVKEPSKRLITQTKQLPYNMECFKARFINTN